MRAQREDLERRVAEVERFSSLLAEKEEEVRVLKEAQARSAAERAGLEADLVRIKASVERFRIIFLGLVGLGGHRVLSLCVRNYFGSSRQRRWFYLSQFCFLLTNSVRQRNEHSCYTRDFVLLILWLIKAF